MILGTIFSKSATGLGLLNRLKLIALMVFIANVPVTAQGQQTLGIAATVNDEMISVLDLQSRITLVAAFSGFKNTPETRQRLAPQVIETLISERIKVQEAKRLNISAQKAEINAENANIAKQIKVHPDQLTKTLEANGIDPTSLTDQLEANIVWGKTVRSKFLRASQVSDEEIDEVVEEIRSNKGKPEYLVSEIFLAVETPQKTAETLTLASRLVQQLKGGANFSAIANNFSQSSSAQRGGSLGWNRASQLAVEIRQTVAGMGVGTITDPIPSTDGIYILLLQAKRISQGLDGPPKEPTKVTLHQFHLAAPPQSPADYIDGLRKKAQAMTVNVQGCEAFDATTKQHGSPLSGELGTFAIDQISKQMQELVVKLPVGQSSPPQATGDGVMVLMVCAREESEEVPVDMEKIRSNIRNQLSGDQMNLSARRFLRDLRRASFIDIRL